MRCGLAAPKPAWSLAARAHSELSLLERDVSAGRAFPRPVHVSDPTRTKQREDFVGAETRAGGEVGHGKRVLIPMARALLLRLPGSAGGLVWNRPFGVLVREGASGRLVRVPDWTRRIQWSLLAAGLAAAVLARLFRR